MRRLVNPLRAADSRFHSTASTDRSACGAAFHSSRSSAIRSPLAFQCVASAAMCSASSTIRSLTSRASWRCVLAGGLDLLAALVDRAGQRLKPHPQAVQVAEALASATDCSSRCTVAWAWAGAISVVGHALLDQRDLGLERLELAPEERERLFRAPRRPRADHPLAIGGTHVDRPVGVYPTPGIVGGGHGEPPGSSAAPVLGASCVAQVLLDGHAVDDDFLLGYAPAGRIVHEVPALATFWRISRPDVIVPNGV